MKSPSWSRQRGGGRERNKQKEREREFEHVWKNSFIFTLESLARPSMPIHFLELAIVSPSGTIRTHSHTHTYTHAWLASAHFECTAILLLHGDSHRHTRILSVGMTARKWAAAAGGVPTLLYRNWSTPEASPHPILTPSFCMCICVGVLFVCWQMHLFERGI